jgi:hypothetical protein
VAEQFAALCFWGFNESGLARGRARAGGRIVHPNVAQAAAAGLGAACAIGAMEWSSLAVQYPLAFIPFATSIAPVLAGALSLTAFACLWHRWVLRRPWPHRWL